MIHPKFILISLKNDNTPVFTGAIEFTLLENQQNVSYVGKLMAEDRDSGRNGALVFAPGVPSTYSNEYIEAMNAITILKDGNNQSIDYSNIFHSSDHPIDRKIVKKHVTTSSTYYKLPI